MAGKLLTRKRGAGAGAAAVLAVTAIALTVALTANRGHDANAAANGSAVATNTSDGTSLASQCDLIAYNTATDLTDPAGFGYGAATAECCQQLKCPFAVVTPLDCTRKSQAMYEVQCCAAAPANGDYSACDAGATFIAQTDAASVATCEPQGIEFVHACEAVPAAVTQLNLVQLIRSVGGTEQPAAAPVVTPAPTRKFKPTVEVTPAPTDGETVVGDTPVGGVVPADRKCEQTNFVPGVPDGSCVQVMCKPDSITPGKDFHTTVRWCLQRPRAFHGSFDIIDRDTKDPYGSTGFTPGGAYQCGEHTYTQNFKAVTPQPDLMFKFFLQPVWAPPDLNSYDPFPNVIAEVGLNKQPDFGALVNDCAPVPTRVWNVAPTGQQNGIDFPKLPDCVTPGEAWSIRVNTHLETEDAADLRVNLQIGTGADKYLGAKDIYVGESNVYGVLSNPVATKWSDLPPKYWTSHDIEFTSKQTELVNKGDNIYIAAFMVPKGEVYDAKQGWTYLQREFFLNLKFC